MDVRQQPEFTPVTVRLTSVEELIGLAELARSGTAPGELTPAASKAAAQLAEQLRPFVVALQEKVSAKPSRTTHPQP